MITIQGNDIYTGNRVTEELVQAVKELLAQHAEVEVSFSVTGRTMHQILAHQLYSKLSHNDYDAEITYNYGCKLRKKPSIHLVTIEVNYTDIEEDSLVYVLKHGFTTKEASMRYIQELPEAPNLKELLGSFYAEGDTFDSYGTITTEKVSID